ncbi:MAG: phosphatase PAP2 family protein [Ignavibacteriaceae bacterium]
MAIFNKILVLALILLLIHPTTNAQQKETLYLGSNSFHKNLAAFLQDGTSQDSSIERNYLPKWYKLITNVPLDFYSFGKEIINKNSIEPILILSSITAGLIFTDQRNWENSKIIFKKNPGLLKISDFTVNLGEAKWQLGLAGATAIYGYFAKDNQAIQTSFESIEAIISSGLFVQVLKRISGRQSPAVSTKQGGQWDIFPDLGEYQHFQPNYYSYPSGHITSLTAFLTVINENYSNVKWLRPVSYILIGALGISLVQNDMHWYSDLPLGVAIGYCFGKIVSKRYNNHQLINKNIPSSFSIIPFLNEKGISVLFNYSF